MFQYPKTELTGKNVLTLVTNVSKFKFKNVE
jgi:hypothetical protein